MRIFHRNGVVALEQIFVGRVLHGLCRTWYRNGQLATAEPYRHGLLHGICREWNEEGRLLGSYRMRNGTGIQYSWFQDGRPQSEISTVSGLFTGRSRLRLSDGSLLRDEWLIENHKVSRAEYLKAAAAHLDWPKYTKDRSRQRVLSRSQVETRAYRLHCESLLSRKTSRDAAEWLNEGNPATCALGRLGRLTAKRLVADLAGAGAKRVVAADIYYGKRGREFADVLFVQLPASRKRRQAIRRSFASLSSHAHCAVQPDRDKGEDWLYAYFG